VDRQGIKRSSPSSRRQLRAGAGQRWSVSAVSRDVAELERHLDARLLNRTTRRLSLTEAGRAFHERAVQLLADLEEAEQSASEGGVTPRGTLKLTCPITYGERVLAPVIAAFAERYPEVRVDIDQSDRIVDLVDEGFDLAVRIGAIKSQLLVARRIGTTAVVCCASPAYLARHGTPRAPEDLAKHACLTYEFSPTRNQWRFLARRRSTSCASADRCTEQRTLLASLAAEARASSTRRTNACRRFERAPRSI
jgi:DNA-binding transcriptional LysR family regulator